MEYQRGAVWIDHAAALHLADEDNVVALVIAAAVMALEPRQRLREDRQAGRAEGVIDVGKAVALKGGEALAQVQLIRRQDIDDVVRAGVEQRE